MHRITRALGLAALLAALIVPTAPASAAAPKTRYVDGDGHASAGNCNGSGHAFTHIQDAVDASGKHDTVIVCPGTYTEQVTIDGNREGLTLKSSKPFGATIKTPAHMAANMSVSSAALILVSWVDQVTVQGFKTIVRTHAPCSEVSVTIAVIGSRQVAIRGNRLLAPGAGASADCSQEDGIVITDQWAMGDPARSANGIVGFNEVRDASYIGIGAGGFVHPVRVDIVHNSVRAYFGIPSQPTGGPLVRRTSSTRSTNFGPAAGTRRNRPSALPMTGTVFGVLMVTRISGRVRGNVIQGYVSDAGQALFAYGVALTNFTSMAPQNGSLDVRDNLIRRALTGILVSFVSGATVRDNTIRNVSTGLQAQFTGANVVKDNDIRAKDLGLDIAAETGDNIFRRNSVSGNGGICRDQSSGSGTSDTGNTWSGNTATVASDPVGICTVTAP